MQSRAATTGQKSGAQALERGRVAFQKHAWRDAFSQLSAADRETELEPEDLVQTAQAALLIGKEAEGCELLTRAHQAFLNNGKVQLAARCAFFLGFRLSVSGEFAKAGGWLARGSRLLDDQPDCVERGYFLLTQGYRSFHEGAPAAAYPIFVQVVTAGRRFGDKDLMALGLQGQGRALIRQGEITRGVALLDEAMIAVTAGDVSPLNAGGIYCSVLEGCGEIFDLQRAQEWTTELEKWCASQPDLVPYRGHCLVRRAELLRMHGRWEDSLEWSRQAIEWLSRPAPKPDIAAAYYQLGEIQRLRGNLGESEEAYRRATEWNRCCGPGVALLRLAQGRVDAAHAAIQSMQGQVQEPALRSCILDAYVEIALAAKDVTAARAAADELEAIAARQDILFLRALALRASSSVLLAEGKARDALPAFEQSRKLWHELQTPYEAARVRSLIAAALLKLEDPESARQELNEARQMFERLGAAADLIRVDALLSECRASGATKSPLTDRELQVLRLVASGMTNRGIAGKLKISEKTVARHLSNIFTKLDLSSRSVATAYAYDHKLV